MPPCHHEGTVRWQLVTKYELTVLDEVLGDNSLDSNALQGSNSAHLEGLATEEIGRPHYRHILRRHTRVVVLLGHSMKMFGEVLESPGRGKVNDSSAVLERMRVRERVTASQGAGNCKE